METSRRSTTEINMDIHPKRIAWGAVIAGTLVMLVTMLLLSLLGLGIGLGSINPASEQQPMEGLGTGAIIWWVISNLIAVFAGSYVAGKLTNVNFKGSALLHGVVSWSLYTLLSFFILSTTVGAIFSGIGSMVTKSVSTIGSGVGSLIEGGQDDGLNLQSVFNQSGGQGDTAFNSKELMNVLKGVFIEDGKLNKNIQRTEVENAIAQNTRLNQDQVRQMSDKVYQVYQQGLSKIDDVKQKVEDANKVASKAAIWSFIALLIGAIVSAIGGRTGGTRDDDEYVKRAAA